MVERWHSPFKETLGFTLNIGINVLPQFLLNPVEEFLCVTSNLGSTPTTNMLLNFFPISSVKAHRYNSNVIKEILTYLQ